VNISDLVAALDLPASARVDRRVPKKLLLENGAPTAADKRAIQEGIDELQWIAALKPTTIGVPAFADETREYLEIAVVAVVFRPGAKATRLVELIHRSIPYPVLLITSDAEGLVVSVTHKRRAQNEAGKVVVEGVIATGPVKPERLSGLERAFVDSLALAKLASRDLFTVYESWAGRIEALKAAQITGAFAATNDAAAITRRRLALDVHARLTREAASFRTKAVREKQMNRKVALNMEIRRLETAAAHELRNL
jgi:ABC-type amino acid transport substrate-binding protein